MPNPPKLFISYSHDSIEHQQMVLELANRFRMESRIDCEIDQHLLPAYPPEGWMKWMRDRIEQSDYVLMIFTPTYRERYERNVKVGGLGVAFEGLVISEMLYEEYSITSKFIPVICREGSIDNITYGLRGGNNYKVPNDFQTIADLINGKRYNPLPPLAEISTPQDVFDGIPVATELIAKSRNNTIRGDISNSSRYSDNDEYEIDDDIPIATELVARRSVKSGLYDESLMPVALPASGRKTDDEDLTPVALPSASKRRRIRANKPNELDLSWASKTGEDQYGQYADLQIKDVVQRFRLIESGRFWMGPPEQEAGCESEYSIETRHRVTLSHSFWLADTVCTQALWTNVLGDCRSEFIDNENNPVENISWGDAKEFIRTLDCMNLGVSFCLPTEAQWEYACRAGTNTPFSFGRNITPNQVNYNGRCPYNHGEEGLDREKTVHVKFFTANNWGLFEMHGNVWEWCQDAYKDDLESEDCIDPVYDELDAGRVVRGGSWRQNGGLARLLSVGATLQIAVRRTLAYVSPC